MQVKKERKKENSKLDYRKIQLLPIILDVLLVFSVELLPHTNLS